MPPSTLIQYANQRNLCLEAESRVITVMYYPFIHEPNFSRHQVCNASSYVVLCVIPLWKQCTSPSASRVMVSHSDICRTVNDFVPYCLTMNLTMVLCRLVYCNVKLIKVKS